MEWWASFHPEDSEPEELPRLNSQCDHRALLLPRATWPQNHSSASPRLAGTTHARAAAARNTRNAAGRAKGSRWKYETLCLNADERDSRFQRRGRGHACGELYQAPSLTGAGGLRRTALHVTRPAAPQTSAPAATVQGTPTACDRKPDSSPPKGYRAAKHQRPDTHHAPPHRIRHARGRTQRVRRREVEQHPPAAHRQGRPARVETTARPLAAPAWPRTPTARRESSLRFRQWGRGS